MKKEKSILTVLFASLIALFFLGSRTYYAHDGHMMGGMHGNYNTGQTGNYGMYGHGMMGAGMGCSIMGSTEVVDYYLYNKDALNLSKKQITTLTSLRDKYYKESLALRTELYEKNFDLESILAEKEIDLSKVRALTSEIAPIESKLRYNSIESFTKAKNVLTKEQINKLDTETSIGHMH